MSRVDENQDFIDEFCKIWRERKFSDIFYLLVLIDISKSLAIIADKLKETEDGNNN